MGEIPVGEVVEERRAALLRKMNANIFGVRGFATFLSRKFPEQAGRCEWWGDFLAKLSLQDLEELWARFQIERS